MVMRNLTGALFPSFLLIVEEDAMTEPAFWLFSSVSLVMIFVSRYLFAPDKDYCYHLTPMGIHYTEQDMIPEVAYKIARGFAWVGIVVCIIVAFMFGPLAFVGAGAFALMSFGMTNFQSSVDKSHIFIDERSVVFHIMNDGVVSFTIPEKGKLQYKGLVYTSTLEEKMELLTNLQSLFINMEIMEIKRLNDQYKHPIYQQDEVAE
ncbi:membrane protein [Aliivibrio wodanis]|uniref:Membrane protein n=1 Tax=Aliivibrio wodanis TaxID=80852 RepID=A0A090I718_9GAMM|nr:membrane protein [Aliivibrio wodanis]